MTPFSVRAPSFAVTSADPDRRRDWAQVFSDDAVLRCAGPSAGCPLVAGRSHCPILDHVDLAVYDLDAVTPDLLAQIVRRYPTLPLVFARDRLAPDGSHRPVVSRFVHRDRADRACFGTL